MVIIMSKARKVAQAEHDAAFGLGVHVNGLDHKARIDRNPEIMDLDPPGLLIDRDFRRARPYYDFLLCHQQ